MKKRKAVFTHKKNRVVPNPSEGPTEEEFRKMTLARAFVVHVYEHLSDHDEDAMAVDEKDDDIVLDENANEDRSVIIYPSGHKYREVPTTFRKGDDAVLSSPRNGTPDEWIGRIEQIRCAADGSSWARVTWYWSRADLATYVRTFNPESFPPRERVFSDLSDIVSCYSFLRVVYVHTYDEGSLDPLALGPDDYFWRCTFQHRMRSIQPKLGIDTCLCHRPYNPFSTLKPKLEDQSQEGKQRTDTSEVMHFCPRPNCSQWYHTSCLVTQGFVDPVQAPYRGDRGVRVLAVDPDSDVPCAHLATFCERLEDVPIAELPESAVVNDTTAPPKRKRGRPRKHPLPVSSEGLSLDAPRKRKRGRPRKHPLPLSSNPRPSAQPDQRLRGSPQLSLMEVISAIDLPQDTLAGLHPAIVYIAQCPIVRQPGPAANGWFPLGNISEVVLARRLVYAALSGIRAHPGGKWTPQVEQLVGLVEKMERGEPVGNMMWVDDPDESGEAILDSGEGDPIEALKVVCDELSKSHLLASPYTPYWVRRQGELETEDWMRQPPLFCPKCRGAI